MPNNNSSNSLSDFEKAFAVVVGIEAGYTNNPRDPGGETKYGISKRAYPTRDIANLSLQDAKDIYYTDYWLKTVKPDDSTAYSLFVFDCAVNQGVDACLAMRAKAKSPADFLSWRAVRYAGTHNFDAFGHGWMRRLFCIATGEPF